MAEPYFTLSRADRREVLSVIASHSGRPAHILEKDVYVVWTLAALFGSEFGRHLVFKGGTSLSKAYGAIRRFSEDIDLTYDIRAFAPDLVWQAGDEALPPSNSQEAKWSKAIRNRLPVWVSETALPVIKERLAQADIAATVRAENDCLAIEYEPIASGYGYMAPRILVEFGARSTGEPATVREVACDAAAFQPGLVFPVATPRVMSIERTFWEKLTAIHVFCLKGGIKGRLARHWHDISALDAAGITETALRNREIAEAVARHKRWFFEAKDASGAVIDYLAAAHGGLRLVPEGATLAALTADYEKMIADGLLLEEAEPFNAVIARCRTIQDRANEQTRRQHRSR